jgi:hypothetical protein
MNQLNCCKEFNIEYESRPQDTSGKIGYPKPARFIYRIREFLSFIIRTRGNGARRQKQSKGVDEREQHVRKTSVRKVTVSYKESNC